MRYGLGILFIAFLVIVGAVIIFAGGDNNPSAPIKNAPRFTKLADYEDKDTSSISWTQQGRLLGEDQRYSLRVTVTSETRKIELLNGYEDRVERSQEYPNTPEAYETLIRALDGVSFGKERNVAQADERAVCPLGNRYIYRVTDAGSEVMRSWSDNCKSADGPFGGGSNAAAVIKRLFKGQITDYSKFVSGLKI